nr:hypothetical protein [Thermoanaerobacter sp. RKWS2]
MHIDEILNLAVEIGASDVHITVGTPVMMRLDGTLLKITEITDRKETVNFLNDFPEWKETINGDMSSFLIKQLFKEDKKYDEYLKKRNYDFAYETESGLRFRVNSFFKKIIRQ